MPDKQNILLAAKCAPDISILANIEKAGIPAVEIYTNGTWLLNLEKAKQTCMEFPFQYAIHAPTEGYEIDLLAELASEIKARIVIFHNIYWDSEWKNIVKTFSDLNVKICMENTFSALEPLKFMRKFKIGLCFDLEHVQIECAGFRKEPVAEFIKKASHIHLSGYYYGSKLWHSHIHHSPEQSIDLLDLLNDSGYTGFAVSEASIPYQTLSEFKKLAGFFKEWQNSR
jgi:sugar phosphate isomerase/epimerase